MINFKKTIAAHTLGCKVNVYDTEALLELFKAKGYEVVDFNGHADVYIINTCTVTGISDRKSRQMIRRALSFNKNAVVVATGCYAQTKPDEISSIPGVSIIVGVKDRGRIVELVENYKAQNGIINLVSGYNNTITFENMPVTGLAGRTRAFVKIQEGCENFCSYCIIPYARGPIRSRDISDILDEVKRICENGVKEIVISGISVASYGKDLNGISLTKVLYSLSDIEAVKRIRLSSMGPNAINSKFIECISALPKICQHFHLSLQSGNDNVLKRMNRKYLKADYENAVENIRKILPKASITTDIITGFPGETLEEHNDSLTFVERLGLSDIHVFPYSKRQGTAAAKFPNQVEKSEKNRRVADFLELGQQLRKNFISNNVGHILDVLFEKSLPDNLYEGFTSNYITVKVRSIDKNLSGDIISVKLDSAEENYALGHIDSDVKKVLIFSGDCNKID